MKKGTLSADLLQKIKESVNLIQVVGEHVVLRKSGANYVGLCPFHSERTPSFSVSEAKQLYHCYGCKKGGDLVSFVMELLGVSFIEAIDELADRAKVSLPVDWHPSESDPEGEKRGAQREKLALAFKLNRFAAAFFHQNLSKSTDVQNYFRTRGVGPDETQSFYLGSTTTSWDDLSHHMILKKAPLDLAVEIGLIRPSPRQVKTSRGNGFFDSLRGRAIFPILNQRGKVAGFGGRALGDEAPKYLNSSESLVFQKGKLAFGLYQAQKYIREQDEIILVEGYFDVLALHAAGFRNVVATCGTSLTPDHLVLFKRFANKMTVLFDGDKAGQVATERAMEVGLDRGWVLYGAQMPTGMDPDEVVIDSSTGTVRPEGKEQMSTILNAAKPLLDSGIDQAIHLASGGAEDLAQSVKKIGKWLARYEDSVGREVRLQQVHQKLGISRQLLVDAMGKLSSKSSGKSSGKSSAKSPGTPQYSSPGAPRKPSPVIQALRVPLKARNVLDLNNKLSVLSPTEKILLAGIIRGDSFSQVFSEAQGQLPRGAVLQEIWDYLPAREFVGHLFSESGRLDQLRASPETFWNEGGLDPQIRSVLTETLLASSLAFSMEDFRGALSKNIFKLWARFSQRIITAIAEAEAKKDEELQMRWMKEYLDVQRKMKEFSNFYDEE